MGAAETKESRSRDSTEYVFRECTGRCTHRDECMKHLETCNYSEVTCPSGCGQSLYRLELSDHKSLCIGIKIQPTYCSRIISERTLKDHLAACRNNPYTEVSCTLKCGSWIERRNLMDHTSNKCPLRAIRCKFCRNDFHARDNEAHQSNCEMAPVACPRGCGETLMKSELNKHQSQLCKMIKLTHRTCGKIFAPKDFLDEMTAKASSASKRAMLETISHISVIKWRVDHIRVCPEVPIPCPQCSVNRLRRRLPKHLSTTCPERQVSCERCNLSFKAKEKDAHEASCDLVETDCPKKCGKCPLRKDISTHLKEECLFRDVSCLLCQEILPIEHLSDHLQVCNKRLVSCFYCEQKGLVYDQLEYHYKTCYKKPRPCLYAALGCQYQGPQDDLADHQEEYQSHWPLLTRSAELAINLNQEMNVEIENLRSENWELSLNLKTVLCKQKALEWELEEMKDNYEYEGDASLREDKTVNYSQFKSIIDISENNQWKVSDYSKLKQRMQTTFVWSKSLYTTGKRGYHFALGMRIHFTKTRGKNKIGLFIALFKGPYDDELKWPFPYTVRFKVLLHGPADKGETMVGTLCSINSKMLPQQLPSFLKPKRARNGIAGKYSVLLLEDLEDPGCGYIKDDAILFLVDVF